MNLEELYKLLRDNIFLNNNKNIKDLYKIIKKYNGTDWKKFVNINKDNYNKIYINGNDDFEIFIITWNSYQESKIHDHSAKGCIYKILKGHLVEEEYDNNLKLLSVKSLFSDSYNIGYIDNSISLHKIINYNDSIAVSLHIYSPPNHNTKYFNTNDSNNI